MPLHSTRFRNESRMGLITVAGRNTPTLDRLIQEGRASDQRMAAVGPESSEAFLARWANDGPNGININWNGPRPSPLSSSANAAALSCSC
jgi:hypothetical protein